jgi:hypothetical protein
LVRAPKPVVIPQPSKQALSRGALGLIATIDTSATTVYWEKVEVPIYSTRRYRQLTELRYVAEPTMTYKVVNVLSLALESDSVVGHHALALSGSDGTAQVGLARFAELAFSALCCLDIRNMFKNGHIGHRDLPAV